MRTPEARLEEGVTLEAGPPGVSDEASGVGLLTCERWGRLTSALTSQGGIVLGFLSPSDQSLGLPLLPLPEVSGLQGAWSACVTLERKC